MSIGVYLLLLPPILVLICAIAYLYVLLSTQEHRFTTKVLAATAVAEIALCIVTVILTVILSESL